MCHNYSNGFNTTPHTGLSMKAPKKNIMNLEDDSPEIISNESEQLPEPLINKAWKTQKNSRTNHQKKQ